MDKSIKIYTLAALAFICLLSLSASFDGILGELIYLLSFVLPLSLSLLWSKGNITLSYLKPKRKNMSLILCAAPIILFTVFLLSYITSWLIFITARVTNPPVTDSSFVKEVLTLAAAPAILEEALFRFLPLLLIAPYSKKSCIIISSLYFAMAHMSLFSIPYAFIAGIFFILADIISDNILPSVILHFLNNLISIILEYSARANALYIFNLVFLSAALISLISVIIMRKKYISAIRAELAEGDKCTLPPASALVAAPTAITALINLFC